MEKFFDFDRKKQIGKGGALGREGTGEKNVPGGKMGGGARRLDYVDGRDIAAQPHKRLTIKPALNLGTFTAGDLFGFL